MGRPKLPPHGSVARYRLELKSKSTCEKCRAANSQAKRVERENRAARSGRAQLSIVPDPQSEPTESPTDDSPPPPPTPKRTEIPEGHVNMVGDGIENAVRNFLNSEPKNLSAHIFGEIVISISKVMAVAEPKDIPKLTEEMVDAAKLLAPAPSGGDDDPFGGFGNPT